MGQTFIRLLFALLLSLSSQTVAFAQDIQDGAEISGNASLGTDSTLLDWWWVVPLIGLALFLLMRDRDSDDEMRIDDQGLTGAKGGRTTRRRESDIEHETSR